MTIKCTGAEFKAFMNSTDPIAAALNGIASLTETTIRDAAREYADADGGEAGFIDGARWALSILRGNNGA